MELPGKENWQYWQSDPRGRWRKKLGQLSSQGFPRQWPNSRNLPGWRLNISESTCPCTPTSQTFQTSHHSANSCWSQGGRRRVWNEPFLLPLFWPGDDPPHGVHGAWARCTISKQEETNRAKPIANALAGAEDQMIPKMNPEVSHIPVIIWFYHHLYLIWNPSIGLEYINWNLLCNWQWKVHHVMGFCEQYSACILGHRFSIADSSLHHLTNFGHVVSRKNDHTLINV